MLFLTSIRKRKLDKSSGRAYVLAMVLRANRMGVSTKMLSFTLKLWNFVEITTSSCSQEQWSLMSALVPFSERFQTFQCKRRVSCQHPLHPPNCKMMFRRPWLDGRGLMLLSYSSRQTLKNLFDALTKWSCTIQCWGKVTNKDQSWLQFITMVVF